MKKLKQPKKKVSGSLLPGPGVWEMSECVLPRQELASPCLPLDQACGPKGASRGRPGSSLIGEVT